MKYEELIGLSVDRLFNLQKLELKNHQFNQSIIYPFFKLFMGILTLIGAGEGTRTPMP